jgi:hypothetical protein
MLCARVLLAIAYATLSFLPDHIEAQTLSQSSGGKPAQGRSNPSAVLIEGQLFIVTRGQQVVKLALVPVMVASADEIDKYVVVHANAINQRRAAMAPQIIDLKRKLDEATAELGPLNAEYAALAKEANERCIALKSTPCTSDAQWIELNNRQMMKGRELSALPRWKEKQEITSALNELVKQYRLPRLADFFAGVDTASFLASAKTDADGKFSISVPNGGRVAITARANRIVGEDRERYLWLVWVRLPPRGGAKAAITLANDNLLDTACSECVHFTERIEPHPEADAIAVQR